MTAAPSLSRARTALRRARRLDLPTLRAAWWTARSIRELRARLREEGLDARVSSPPPLPPAAVRGVTAVAHRLRATCLEQSLLLQEWLSAQGKRHAVVIGVPRPDTGPFIAHAWLEGHDSGAEARDFAELMRLDPR